METVHDFFDWSFEVPPMDIKDVDVVGSKLLQTMLNRHVHRLGVAASRGSLLFVGRVPHLVAVCVLDGDVN